MRTRWPGGGITAVVLAVGETPVLADPLAYLVNLDEPSVTVLDTTSLTETTTIPLPGTPEAVVAGASGARVYVSYSTDAPTGGLAVIDVATHAVQTVSFGQVAAGLVAGMPGWKATKTGFRFQAPTASTNPEILKSLSLKAGADGKASAAAAGRGHFGFVLPLNHSPSVTAQLVATNGSCWTSEFYAARRNDPAHFGATSDLPDGTKVPSEIPILVVRKDFPDTPEDPPVILGTPDGSVDGIRDDAVNGLTLRHLRILGTYDGVRLNYVKQAVLEDLDIENSALGIRVNNGRENIISECTVLGTRVEQGILVYYSPGSVVSGTISAGTARENIRVANSAGAVLDHDQVSGSEGSDGVYLSNSPGAQVTSCTASRAYHDGIHVMNSSGLVLTDNSTTDNLDDGFLIANSPPYTSVADVLADGNVDSESQVAIDIN